MKTENDFVKQINYSFRESENPAWIPIYQNAFYGYSGYKTVETKINTDPRLIKLAALGVDKLIRVSGGATYRIDEKVRTVHYPDIAVELVSNNIKGTPGWAVKTDMVNDFFAYRTPVTGLVLPRQEFQNFIILNSGELIREFGIRKAYNNNYTTLFCPVPLTVLKPLIINNYKNGFSN